VTVDALQSAALVAVISSALVVAEARGKDPAAAREAFESWRRELESRNPKRTHRAFARMQRTLMRATGLRVHRRMKAAVFGTAAAVTALVTWDLADRNGDYTPDRRALLAKPWRDVLGLPSGLSD
jgi:hypothetical protein